MEYIRLGRSSLMASKIGFSTESFNTLKKEEALNLLMAAYKAGINFFDTSRLIANSEEFVGECFLENRHDILISSATISVNAKAVAVDALASLSALNTDYIDLYSYKCTPASKIHKTGEVFIPKKNGKDGIYDALLKLKKSGKVRSIGIITTSFEEAKEALSSSLYDCVTVPFSVASDKKYSFLVSTAQEEDIGFLASSPLCNGVIDNLPLSFGFYLQFDNVVPLWSLSSLTSLEQLLYFNSHPPVIDKEFIKEADTISTFFN